MSTKPFLAALALTLVAAGLVSCANKKDPAADGSGSWPGSGYDGYDGYNTPLPSRDEGYSFFGPGSGNVDKSQFAPVYFAFDSYGITGPELGKISQVANFLRAGDANLLVAGFTDAVGTEEYNRVLGERRALAVREQLLGMGVNVSRIQTVSFGEDMPAEIGNDAANRRVEFGVVR